MSEARGAKMREWRRNIFNITSNDEKPMFDRKKRDGSNNARQYESTTPIAQTCCNKDNFSSLVRESAGFATARELGSIV